MSDADAQRLVTLLADMQEAEALELARRLLDQGFDPVRLLGLCREAMDGLQGLTDEMR